MSKTLAETPKASALSDQEIRDAFVALTQAAARAGLPSIGGLHSTLVGSPPAYRLKLSNTSEPQDSIEGG